jgi:hypothetical protein
VQAGRRTDAGLTRERERERERERGADTQAGSTHHEHSRADRQAPNNSPTSEGRGKESPHRKLEQSAKLIALRQPANRFKTHAFVSTGLTQRLQGRAGGSRIRGSGRKKEREREEKEEGEGDAAKGEEERHGLENKTGEGHG